MRAPRIRVKTRISSLQLKLKTPKTDGCAICKGKCLDDRIAWLYSSDRCTRSMSKFMKEATNIIIYETYRSMPLLGNEKVNAPDWEEHIVRYHIVFVKKTS